MYSGFQKNVYKIWILKIIIQRNGYRIVTAVEYCCSVDRLSISKSQSNSQRYPLNLNWIYVIDIVFFQAESVWLIQFPLLFPWHEFAIHKFSKVIAWLFHQSDEGLVGTVVNRFCQSIYGAYTSPVAVVHVLFVALYINLGTTVLGSLHIVSFDECKGFMKSIKFS